MKVEFHQRYTKVYDSYKYTNSEIEQAVYMIIEKRKELTNGNHIIDYIN